MRRFLIIMVGALLCLALIAPLAAASTPAASAGEFRADAVSAASPNYRSFSEAELKSMRNVHGELWGGHYTCAKNSAPYSYFEQDWEGVDLSYLLEQEVGFADNTTGFKFYAVDGYSVTLDMEQMRGYSNPRGLPSLLAWKAGPDSEYNINKPDPTGAPWVDPEPADRVLDGNEGPFRLIVPQKVEGPDPRSEEYSPSGAGTPNWQLAVQKVRAIEVLPQHPGIPAIDPKKIPEGEIIVYGNILNRKTLTVDQLKCINPVTATYSWKNNVGITGDSECTGILADYLLDNVIGLQKTASDVTFLAADGWGWKDAWPLEDIRKAYPGDLKFMLAWDIEGDDMSPEKRLPDGTVEKNAGGEGPIKQIKPQADPDDTNKSKWLKNTRVVEVAPMGKDPGPDATKIPSDRVIFCGAIDASNVPDEWFFAEGCTGFGFETYLSIANPNPWNTQVIVDYFIEGEEPQQKKYEAPARSRTTILVNGEIGEGKNVSTRVEGYHGDSLLVERAMYWNDKIGGHCASGVNAPAAGKWYLAEGCTGEAQGFETWVLLQNPGDEAANVKVTYMTDEGPKEGADVVVPAKSRKNINLAEDGVADTWDVSTMLDADQPIIAERSVYWNARRAGHCEMGVTEMADRWLLAEGATAGIFETWVLVQNPGDEEAKVTLTFNTSEGVKEGAKDFAIPANSRHSFNLVDYVTDFDVSTEVTSDKGVIAERAMYWNGKSGGHGAHGQKQAKFRAYLAEGATAGGFETWVLLQNPSDCDAEVCITYQTESGAVVMDPLVLEKGNRTSINVGEAIGETYDVSTIVRSSAPIVVERAVYWNGRVEGSCSTGYSAW